MFIEVSEDTGRDTHKTQKQLFPTIFGQLFETSPLGLGKGLSLQKTSKKLYRNVFKIFGKSHCAKNTSMLEKLWTPNRPKGPPLF